MEDTLDVRKKMLAFWHKFEQGEMSAQVARTHIGFARTVMDTLKVEIAAGHLGLGNLSPVALGNSNTPKRLSKAA